ncbi:MAG: FAD-binding oxidoreductase [Halobacteriales archaeon]|nr:FAD-binding oxidoreductase [Halobacteriales archaeon]
MSDLQSRFDDRCLLPEDDGFGEAITIWNAATGRSPATVVRCENTEDVVAALQVVTEFDAPFSVKAGGHMTTGHAIVEDGVVLDLSPMNGVDVDPDSGSVTVQGGATWDVVNESALDQGLIPPGIPDAVGVAGFTLGGGMGVTCRLNGLACDNLRSAEVVTATGEVVTASEGENGDLFWAIRGGSGNVGIVTSFEFDCVEAPRECLVANVLYPFDGAGEYLDYFNEVAPDLPDETFPTAAVMTVPHIPDLPEALHGELAVAGYVMGVGSSDDLEATLESFADFGDPHVSAVYPADFTELYEPFEIPSGQRHHWESFYLNEMNEAFIETLLDETFPKPTPQSNVAIYGLGGAINDVARDATAYPHRDAQFAVHIQGHWLDESDDEACVGWTRDLHETLREFGTGGEYVNNQTDTDEGRVRAAFGQNYDRLAEVKAKWDPENRLLSTQAVEPE